MSRRSEQPVTELLGDLAHAAAQLQHPLARLAGVVKDRRGDLDL